MRAHLFTALLLPIIYAQDDVQVDCTPDHMEIRVTKAVVDTMGFDSADVHLEDPDCSFGQIDDGQFYIYRMSPLTACGTEVKLNGTHVEYRNKLVAGSDGAVLEKGAVIVGSANSPSPYGVGKFMASMSLFKTELYEETYQSNPELTTADYLNVGVQLLGDFTDDIYIRMQRCWATPTEQSDSDTSFELIDTGCGTEDASNQGLDITVNGDQTFGRFRAPVFKFVQYTAVWLHCDLQICIRETCEPICTDDASPRKGGRKNKGRSRRGANSPYGPEDWEESHLISIGPLRRATEQELKIEVVEEVEEIFEGQCLAITCSRLALLLE